MENKVKFKRQFLFGGYTGEYKTSIKTTTLDVSKLTGLLIDNFFSNEKFFKTPLVNIQGTQFFDSNNTDNPSTKNELFYIAGRIPDIFSTPEDEKTIYKSPYTDFYIKISSDFLNFTDDNKITFSPILHTSTSWPKDIPWTYVYKICPLIIKEMRFGFEVFQNRLILNSISLAPISTQVFSLSYKNEQIQIEIGAEHLKTKSEIPFQSVNLLEKIDNVFNYLFKNTLTNLWNQK